MGQKSRAKRQQAPKKVTSVSQVVAEQVASPSLIKTSASFQPKTVQFEEALMVPRSDIRKIGLLGAIMILLLAALTVFSVASPVLQKIGNHLAQVTRL